MAATAKEQDQHENRNATSRPAAMGDALKEVLTPPQCPRYRPDGLPCEGTGASAAPQVHVARCRPHGRRVGARSGTCPKARDTTRTGRNHGSRRNRPRSYRGRAQKELVAQIPCPSLRPTQPRKRRNGEGNHLGGVRSKPAGFAQGFATSRSEAGT